MSTTKDEDHGRSHPQSQHQAQGAAPDAGAQGSKEPPAYPAGANEFGEKNPGYVANKKAEDEAAKAKAAEHKDDAKK